MRKILTRTAVISQVLYTSGDYPLSLYLHTDSNAIESAIVAFGVRSASPATITNDIGRTVAYLGFDMSSGTDIPVYGVLPTGVSHDFSLGTYFVFT